MTCEVANMTCEVAKTNCEVGTSTYKIDTGCNLTRNLTTQAETPLFTSVSTFCFFNNRYLKGQKNKKSFHFLLPTAQKRYFI